MSARASNQGRLRRELRVESVTKGSTVSYEAVIRKNGKKSEVAVNSDGSVNK